MILSKDRFNEFVSLLLNDWNVIAPTSFEDDVQFREISDPIEVSLTGTRTTESIKKYFLPQTEILFTHTTDEKGVTIYPPSRVTDVRILFGVRPCDLHAVHQIPLVYRSTDQQSLERIDRTIFICHNCNIICSDSSFCSSMNTGPFYHANKADIIMTTIDESFFLEGRTKVGKSILGEMEYLFTNANEEHWQKRTEIEQNAIASQRISFDSNRIEYLMSDNDSIWDEKAKDCFRCGGCNYICPTCVCYDVTDRGGVRERSWDSCLMSGFTILASGDNPRRKLSQRIAQRYLHKFVHTKIQSDIYSCVGCGRCTDICLFNDNIGETVANFTIKESNGSRSYIQGLEPFKEIDVTRQKESMIPFPSAIVGKVLITENDTLFNIVLSEKMEYESGQFVEIGVFGLGEIPVSIASSYDLTGKNAIDLVIRDVGKVSHALHGLPIGSSIGIRGPYGTSWPVKDAIGKHAFVIAGGIGLCPLRGTIFDLIRIKADLKSLNLYYGAREPSLIIFKEDLAEWRKDISVHLTVDSITGQDNWSDDIGFITEYFNNDQMEIEFPLDEAMAFICGPQIMIKNVCRRLEELGFKDKNIYVSLERMMKCGIGTCGHCTMGEVHVCRDGPVFSLRQLKEINSNDYPF